MEINPKEVWRVTSDKDPTVLIALDLKYQDGNLTWFDSSRDRGHPVAEVREEESELVFETERGWTYRFQPLTKEVYDREVRERVELSPNFESTDELKRFYLKSFLGWEMDDA